MITIDIPGFRLLHLRHLVVDYNGTIAVDGQLLPGVAETFCALAADIQIHVLTADTFGSAAAQLADLPITLTVIPRSEQTEAKNEYVRRLGAQTVIAIGNGRNDHDMLEAAIIGIALIQAEGASARTLAAADIVCARVDDALALLSHPKRLIATLRS